MRDLDSPTDYRRLPRALSKVYYHPISEETKLEFDKLFDGLTADTPITTSTTLNVWGRKLAIPKAAAKVAYFTFADLCGRSLSAADYLEIVRNFDTIFIDEIPQLTLNERDRARRFILFIDAAYESKTKLFTLSEVPITQIFSDKKGTSSAEEMSAHQRSMMDDLGLNAETVGASSIFTGDEEVFAFARAVVSQVEYELLQCLTLTVAVTPERNGLESLGKSSSCWRVDFHLGTESPQICLETGSKHSTSVHQARSANLSLYECWLHQTPPATRYQHPFASILHVWRESFRLPPPRRS